MIALIRPVLMSFLNSDKVKRLIVDMLRKLAEQSDKLLTTKPLISSSVVSSAADGLGSTTGTAGSTAP